MAFPSHSQSTLTTKQSRVNIFVTSAGDTMITMSYEDARILLEDVLKYQYADSLLSVYKEQDSLNTRVITLQKDVIVKMTEEKMNLEQIVENLERVIANKNTELALKDDIIKQQKKSIRKQKIQKVIGFSAAIILPIIVLLIK
jgi:hypothetical protein